MFINQYSNHFIPQPKTNFFSINSLMLCIRNIFFCRKNTDHTQITNSFLLNRILPTNNLRQY
jgi:hypothetical protein